MSRTISIAVGDDVKTVHIHFLGNWMQNDREKLREPARALRVWKLIRSWFQHRDAVDLEGYNQRVLDAVDDLNK